MSTEGPLCFIYTLPEVINIGKSFKKWLENINGGSEKKKRKRVNILKAEEKGAKVKNGAKAEQMARKASKWRESR